MKKIFLILFIMSSFSYAMFEEVSLKQVEEENKYLEEKDIFKIKNIKGSFKEQNKIYKSLIRKEKDPEKLYLYIKKYIFLSIENKRYREIDNFLKKILFEEKTTKIKIERVPGLVSFIYNSLATVNYKLRNFSKSQYYLEILKNDLKDYREWLLAKLKIESSGNDKKVISFLSKNIKILKSIKNIDKVYILNKVYEITKEKNYNEEDKFFIEKRIIDLLDNISVKKLAPQDMIIFLNALVAVKDKLSEEDVVVFFKKLENKKKISTNIKVLILIEKMKSNIQLQEYRLALRSIDKILKLKIDKKSRRYKNLLEYQMEIKYIFNTIKEENLLSNSQKLKITSLGESKKRIIFLNLLRKFNNKKIKIMDFSNNINKLLLINQKTYKRYGFQKENFIKIQKYKLIKKIIEQEKGEFQNKKEEKARLFIDLTKELKLINYYIYSYEDYEKISKLFFGVKFKESKYKVEKLKIKEKIIKTKNQSIKNHRMYFDWMINNEKIKNDLLLSSKYLIEQYVLKEDLKNLRSVLEATVIISNKLDRVDILIDIYMTKLGIFNYLQKIWFLENLYIKSKKGLNYESKKEILTELLKLYNKNKIINQKLNIVYYLIKENYENFQYSEALKTFSLIKEDVEKVKEDLIRLQLKKYAYLSYKKVNLEINAEYWQNKCLMEKIVTNDKTKKSLFKKIKEECVEKNVKNQNK